MLLLLITILGFVSEPILARNLGIDLDLDLELDEDSGWALHLLRGTASLGCIGFLKVVYLLGPGSLWNVRQMNSRDRGARLGWVIVGVGVLNFFWWLWKAVGRFVEERLGRAAGDVEEVGDREDVGEGFWEAVMGRLAWAWLAVKEAWDGVGRGGVGAEGVGVGVGL